jgi:arylsulfatase A-like enzyme
MSLRSRIALLALLTGVGAAGCGGSPEPAPRYNLVFVLSDALRAYSLELYGYPRETAPNLTALAADGLVFEDHLVSYPATPYSVSQMFTGRFRSPDVMNTAHVGTPVRALGDDLLVLPRELQAAGYRTGIVTSHPWWADAPAIGFFDHQALLDPPPDDAYASVETFSDPVREFLDAAGDGEGGDPEPFFLYVHSMDTHGPLRPHPGLTPARSDGWPPMYDRYEGEIRYTDRWLGWLIDELRRRDLLDETIFVFTSDHGEELGEMGAGPWNWSHGYTVRRAQLHVPLVVRMPGGRPAGRVAETTRHLDLAPTLAELLLGGEDAGLDRFRLDGRSLAERFDPDGWRAPDPSEPPVTTPAWNERYRALHRGEMALHHDLWTDRYEAYRSVTNGYNYPADQPVDEAELPSGFRAELDRVQRRSLGEYLRLPPPPTPDGPVVVGVPAPATAAAAGGVTYHPDPADGLWTLVPGRRLVAGEGESPPPIEIGMPWIPGDYRVSVRLLDRPAESGPAAPFLVTIAGSGPGSNGGALEVDPRDAVPIEGAPSGRYLDLGQHRIGALFRVTVAAPEGRVAIQGFRFEPLGGGRGDGAAEAVDPELEERLRALGYVD